MRRLLYLSLLPLLAACGSPDNGRAPVPYYDNFHGGPAAMLRGYITATDGSLSRTQLETGLRSDFDRADRNGDGRLDPDEVRAVNEARWGQDNATTSPVQDWNGDGYVSFDEFAATPRSLFQQIDIDGNGIVTAAEFQPARAPQNRNERAGTRGARGQGRGSPRGQ